MWRFKCKMSTASCLLGVFLVLLSITQLMQAVEHVDVLFKDQSRNPYHIYDYRNHSCKRPCQKDAPPMSCHYYFLFENFKTMSPACHNCPRNHSHCFLPQCVAADGRSRGVLTANRMLPGPVIDVCQGDTVVVLVDNRLELGSGTSIHWHGLLQKGSPHMDGTNQVTQCPINAMTKSAYRFKAVDPGTHFWHSHSSIQRSDGLFGGLVVRTPYELDPHRHLYDYDLPEHYIILTDWSEKSSGEFFADVHHGEAVAVPVSILINGLGSTKNGPAMPHPVFRVKRGRRYRFRMAFNGNVNCPVYVSVDDHSMLMIATDGRNVEPLEVDAFTILSGERYDFVLKTLNDEAKYNYWIRFKGHGRCLDLVFQAAVLRYDGSSEMSLPEGEATNNNTIESDTERILNGLIGVSNITSFQVVDLQSQDPEADIAVLRSKPDKQFYISLAASNRDDERFKPPPQPDIPTKEPPQVRPLNHQLNYISSQLPASPPLTQFKDIPKDAFCNNDTVSVDCSQVSCSCVHLLKLDPGDIVEIVLVSFTRTLIHPMHMHGHTFRVVAMQSFERDLTVKEVKEMDKKGLIPRKRSQAPYKDTIPVYYQSVAIIRFRANNPGFWFFHCHIEFHAELGMSLILQSGEPHDMPKPPKGFPTCGNWRPEPEDELDTLNRQHSVGTETSDGHAETLITVYSIAGAAIIIVVVVIVVFYRRRGVQRDMMLYRFVRNEDNVGYQRFK